MSKTKPVKSAESSVKKPDFAASNLNDMKTLKTSLGILIAVFAFLLYAPSIAFNYTLDDGSVVKENSITTQGIAGIPTILKHSYWFGINDTRVAEYRPVSLVMFAIEWQFFPANPHINHFMNVLLYAITCWLLFLFLCALFNAKSNAVKLLIPFACTLLYAAHPIHTEVVDSIKSRDEILCFLFAITASLGIIKFIEKNKIIYLILGGITYLLSLSSKETSISFIIIIPMLLYVFMRVNTKQIGAIIIVLISVAGIYFFIRSLALRTITESFDHSAINNALYATPDVINQRVTAFYILLKYMLLLVFPHPLSYDYSFNQIAIHTLKDPLAIVAIALYFALGIYAVITIRKKNWYAFAILFFLFTIAPVSNIFLLIGATMAERFLYMPSLGFCLVITLLLIKVTKTDGIKKKFSTVKEFVSVNKMMMMIVFAIVGIYSLKTLARSQDWEDNIQLFGHDVEVVPGSARAHVNNGVSMLKDQYLVEKNDAVKAQLLDKAIVEFKKGIDIYPDNNDSYDALGQAYLAKKDYVNAIYYFEKLIANLPQKNSMTFKFLSQCYEQTKQFDKLAASIDSVIKYEPKDETLVISKGMALGQAGHDSLAIAAFQKAISMNPKSKTAYKDIGVTYANQNRFQVALDYFNKALEIDSTDAESYQFIGGVYNLAKDTARANKFLAKAAYYSKSQH